MRIFLCCTVSVTHVHITERFRSSSQVREKSYTHQLKQSHGRGAREPLKNRSLTSHSRSIRCTQTLPSFGTPHKDGQRDVNRSYWCSWSPREPRVRGVVEAVDEATAITSRLHALETEKHRCDDECCTQRFRGKEVSENTSRICLEWRERAVKSLTALKMELQNRVGSLTQRRDESHGCCRSKRRETAQAG